LLLAHALNRKSAKKRTPASQLLVSRITGHLPYQHSTCAISAFTWRYAHRTSRDFTER
jgi:hypothetical protein